MLVLAATAQTATRNAAALVPIILVATYPGLLLLRNVLTADLLFAVLLNLAMAGLLVATCVGKAARCYAVADQRIFLAALRDRPLAYAGKLVRQMAYGASVAWPPYGLEPVIPVSTDDVPQVSDIMKRHGRAVQPIDLQGGPVRIGLLSDLPVTSTYLFKALSTAFVIAVIFWTVIAVRRRRPKFSTRGGIVIVMWAASIVTAAGAHTLDVWRYLVPAVPMVGIMLSLFAAELAETIASMRRG
jgi:hypothetical protein